MMRAVVAVVVVEVVVVVVVVVVLTGAWPPALVLTLRYTWA